jgi:hypothetical protein
MTPLEALRDMDLLASQVIAAPPEIRALAWWAIIEIDRQRNARLNPTLAAMQQAVPDTLMRDLVNDQRRGVSEPSSLALKRDAKPEPERYRPSHYDPTPLGPPPGVDILDRLMDQEDAKDRRARIVDAAADYARRAAISAAEASSKPDDGGEHGRPREQASEDERAGVAADPRGSGAATEGS